MIIKVLQLNGGKHRISQVFSILKLYSFRSHTHLCVLVCIKSYVNRKMTKSSVNALQYCFESSIQLKKTQTSSHGQNILCFIDIVKCQSLIYSYWSQRNPFKKYVDFKLLKSIAQISSHEDYKVKHLQICNRKIARHHLNNCFC